MLKFKIKLLLILMTASSLAFGAADSEGFIKGSECHEMLKNPIANLEAAKPFPSTMMENGNRLVDVINNISSVGSDEGVLESDCKQVVQQIESFTAQATAARPGSGQLTVEQNNRLSEYQGIVARCDSPNVRLASESVSTCSNRLLREKCQGSPNEDVDMCVGKYQQSLSAANAANIPVQVNGRNMNDILAQVGTTPGSRVVASDTVSNSSGNGGVKLNGPIAFDNTSPDPLRKKKSNLTFTQHVGSPSTYGDKYGISASDALVLCEGEAAVPWAETRGQDPEKNWGPSMNEFVASTVAKFNEKFSQPKEKSAYEQFFNTEVIPEIKLRVETYVKCQALTMMMDNSDYGDQEVENTNDKGKYIKVSALKPELKCETSYHDAQDFYACVKVLNAYDALNIAGQGMQVYQQVDNGMKLADRQTDLQKKTLTGGTIDTTDVLQQQKQTVKDAAGYAQQRAALDTAKVATLFAMLKQMPSKEDLTSQCISTEDAWTKKISESFFTRIKTSLFNALNGATFDKDFSEYKKTYVLVFQNESTFAQGLATTEQGSTGRSICNKVSVSSSSRGGGAVNLLPNQAIKEQMKGEMVKAGVDAASNMAKAALLNKQAGEIDDVINSIKSFEPPPIPEQQLTDMQILECQANPQAENCGTINGRGNVSFTGNGINVGNGQFATTDGQGIDLGNTDPTASNSATSKSDRTGMARKLGGATADAPGDGGILNPVAAAEIKKGGGNPGGGGGGGASAPGAAGGGGAGGKPGTGGGSGASSGQGLAKMKYSGSSSGSLSWSGGGGLARKPAAKVDNPFANLLGKGGGKNGVLDGFRGPASGIGKKEDGLFNMISNRYSQVANDKERLIQYEIKK